MPRRWLPAAMVGLCLSSATCTPSLVSAPPRTVPDSIPDVTAKDLPPEDDIAALLAGLPKLGKPERVSRVVVAPFAVPGGDASLSWIGEAASEVVAERVAAAPGVSVLRRSETARIAAESARAADTDDDAAAAALGRSLGAHFIVYGKAAPAGA